jgi:hypothetical protein
MGMGVAPHHDSGALGQALHALAHIGMAGGDPDAHACSNRHHRRSRTRSTRSRAVASTSASTITRRSFPISITMRPFARVSGSAATVAAVATIARTKPQSQSAVVRPYRLGAEGASPRHQQ